MHAKSAMMAAFCLLFVSSAIARAEMVPLGNAPITTGGYSGASFVCGDAGFSGVSSPRDFAEEAITYGAAIRETQYPNTFVELNFDHRIDGKSYFDYEYFFSKDSQLESEIEKNVSEGFLPIVAPLWKDGLHFHVAFYYNKQNYKRTDIPTETNDDSWFPELYLTSGWAAGASYLFNVKTGQFGFQSYPDSLARVRCLK